MLPRLRQQQVRRLRLRRQISRHLTTRHASVYGLRLRVAHRRRVHPPFRGSRAAARPVRRPRKAAMKLSESHIYPAPVDRVIEMLQDKSATVDKYEGMGHQDVQVLEFEADDDTLK